MAGHPDAHAVIARLHDVGKDKDGFYTSDRPRSASPLALI